MTPSPTPESTAAPGMVRMAWLVGVVWLVLACCLTPDFGPTWDIASGAYPYGDEVVAWWGSDVTDFVEIAERNDPPQVRQPYPAFYQEQFPWYEIYPLSATLSAVSSRVLWHHLGMVPAMAAHQIVVPLVIAVFLGCFTLFLARRVGRGPALLTVAFLVTSPRFLAHSIHNLKDLPECAFYSLTMLAAFRAFTEPRITPWVLCGAAAGAALAQKANALFLPFHVLALLILGWLAARRPDRSPAVRLRPLGVVVTIATFCAVYLLASPAFWHDTVARIGLHFGQVRKISNAALLEAMVPGGGSWMTVLSAPLNALITTPIPVLVLAAVGIVKGRAPRLLKLFLVLGLAFPILRLMMPNVRDFDGVRHFIEFYPPTCALAALGLWWCVGVLRRWGTARARSVPVAAWVAIAGLLALLPGVSGVVQTYPYGTCYFNALIGGLQGAQRQGVPQATDYWASSYWMALRWLSDHAEPAAALYVPIAKNVAVSAAPVRLRQDIDVQPQSLAECPGELFVMYCTRKGFYDHLVDRLEAEVTPVHQVVVQGGVILKIYRLATDAGKRRVFGWLTEERRRLGVKAGFMQWALGDTGNRDKVRAAVLAARRDGVARGGEVLRAALPQLAPGDGAVIVAWLLRVAG